MTKFHYLTLAYTLFWIALAVYMLGLGRRLQRVSDIIHSLKQRLSSGAPPPGDRVS